MRRPHPILAAFLFLLALLVPSAPAQTPLDYTACELSYPVPGDPRREGLNRLLEKARTDRVEMLILGSSIYDMKGNGGYALAALNAEFAEIYGNAPATAWMPVGSIGTTPPSQLGARGAKGGGTSAPTGYDSTYQLPTFDIYKCTTFAGNFIQFEPDAFSAAPSEFGIPGAYFKTGSTQSYRPEWICTSYGGCSTESSSATVYSAQIIKRTTAAAYTPWGAISGAAGNTLGRTLLQNPVDVTIPTTSLYGRAFNPNSSTFDAAIVGVPLTSGGAWSTYAHDSSAPYYNFVLENSSSGQFFLCAQRWVNTTTTRGVVVSSASQSGYKIGQVVSDRGNSGPVLRAMRPDIVAIALHTNSAGNSYDAYNAGAPSTSYYHLGLALIDWVRTYDPNCWIVLIPDGPRTDLTAGQQTQYGLMVGANRMLADARPNVLAINLTLALENAGYTKATQTFTGYTYKAAWATATAYSVGDIVGLDGGGEVRYARCIQAHTSSSTDKPFLSTNSSDYWRAHRRFLVSNPDVTAAPTDNVHPGAWGARFAAKTIVQLIREGQIKRVTVPRGRRSRRRPGRSRAVRSDTATQRRVAQ